MMSRSRFNQIHDLMTAAARKVYEGVPIAAAWTTQQIVSELGRLNHNTDFSVVQGCLNSLKASGLIKEPTQGKFQRVPVREPNARPAPMIAIESTSDVSPSAVAPITVSATLVEPDPLDVLGELAARATRMAQDLAALASDISDAAIDIQSRMESNDAGIKKLKALQSLLKDLA